MNLIKQEQIIKEITKELEKNKVYRKRNLEFNISKDKNSPYSDVNIINWKLFLNNHTYGAYTTYQDGNLEYILDKVFTQMRMTIKKLVEEDSTLLLNLLLDENFFETSLGEQVDKDMLFQKVLNEKKYEDENTEFLMSADYATTNNPFNSLTILSIKVKKDDKFYGAWTNINSKLFNEENLGIIIDYFNNLKNENKLKEINEGVADISKTFVEIIIEGNNK